MNDLVSFKEQYKSEVDNAFKEFQERLGLSTSATQKAREFAEHFMNFISIYLLQEECMDVVYSLRAISLLTNLGAEHKEKLHRENCMQARH